MAALSGSTALSDSTAPSDRPALALVFIGFMGSGKSTAAAAVAAATGGRCSDSDALVEERLGRSIAEEVEQNGEAAFRAVEETVVLELLGAATRGDVVALGGGSVLSQRVQEALAAHLVVLLDVDTEVAWVRVSGSRKRRPLAASHEAFVELHARRQPLYERLADAILPAGSPPPVGSRWAAEAPAESRGAEGVAIRALPALVALTRAPRGARMLWACARSGEYAVTIHRGLLADREALARLWPLPEHSRRFCVSDDVVAGLYASRLPDVAELTTIPAGEQHKTLASAERVWSALAVAGMRRSDHVVALGGGVVGDLAGFCAATYQRGAPVVHVPTTLVAQVDSAYGGKTGVDLPAAKNYVGAYHQPAGVLVDPDALATLSERELAAGWVEVLKTALIAGGELWESVRAGGAPDERTILACVRTKLAVVAADERDAGLRQTLNLGHTIGHAIEAASGYRRYRHGEAVGLGLLAALTLSGQPALREEVRGLLERRGLPVRLEGPDAEEVLAATAYDKKLVGGVETTPGGARDGALPPFVLVREPGRVEHGCQVEERAVRAAIAELLGG